MALFEKQDAYIIGEGDLLSKSEVMDWLGISRSTIQRMMKDGLPFTRFKSCVAFSKYDTQEWLKENGYGTVRQIKRRKNNDSSRKSI